MLSCTGKRSHRHTILHVSFSNSFGLASARPTPQGLSGAPQYVKLENGYSAHVYDMEVIIDIALQMDTYQALLFRRWLVGKIGNRKECQATPGKQGRTTIIVMNGTMPRGIS